MTAATTYREFLFQLLRRPGWALMSLVASVLLVMGIGSYFGLTIKTRASAVVTTIVVCLMVKYGIAWMFACVGVPLAAGVGAGEAAWGFFGFCIAMVIPAVIHVTIGVAAIRVAAQRVRHDVF